MSPCVLRADYSVAWNDAMPLLCGVYTERAEGDANVPVRKGRG